MKLGTTKLYSSVFDIYKPQSSYPLPPTYFRIFAFLGHPGISERHPGIGESCQNDGLWDISDIQASANVIQTSANVVRMKGYGTICIIDVFQGRSARRPASPWSLYILYLFQGLRNDMHYKCISRAECEAASLALISSHFSTIFHIHKPQSSYHIPPDRYSIR